MQSSTFAWQEYCLLLQPVLFCMTGIFYIAMFPCLQLISNSFGSTACLLELKNAHCLVLSTNLLVTGSTIYQTVVPNILQLCS